MKFRIPSIDHSPFSPDLAPSDFYLFGKLKDAFTRHEFESPQKLLLAVRGVTGSIGPAELKSVFDTWERRLSECIQMKGEYIAQGEFKSRSESPCSHCQTEMPKNNQTPQTY
jgi:hypothetical protein